VIHHATSCAPRANSVAVIRAALRAALMGGTRHLLLCRPSNPPTRLSAVAITPIVEAADVEQGVAPPAPSLAKVVVHPCVGARKTCASTPRRPLSSRPTSGRPTWVPRAQVARPGLFAFPPSEAPTLLPLVVPEGNFLAYGALADGVLPSARVPWPIEALSKSIGSLAPSTKAVSICGNGHWKPANSADRRSLSEMRAGWPTMALRPGLRPSLVAEIAGGQRVRLGGRTYEFFSRK